MTAPRPILLVHGAWHGGWCWNRVAPRLQTAGAQVFTPTLTGLGERAHLSAQPAGLATHIDDIVGVIKNEELDDLVLVGHSYAGMVITGVADRLKARIARLVYLDAAVPADGDDFASHVPGTSAAEAERRRAAFRSMAPDGVWIPPVGAELVGVTKPDDVAWLQRRMTPHPLRSWLDPLRLQNGGQSGIPKTYVLVTRPPTTLMGYPAQGEAAKRGGEWTYREIACGHDLMVVEPERTAELILEARRSSCERRPMSTASPSTPCSRSNVRILIQAPARSSCDWRPSRLTTATWPSRAATTTWASHRRWCRCPTGPVGSWR